MFNKFFDALGFTDEYLSERMQYYKDNPTDINGKRIPHDERWQSTQLKKELYANPIKVFAVPVGAPAPSQHDSNTSSIKELVNSINEVADLARNGAFQSTTINIVVNNDEQAQKVAEILKGK